ncbi:MAG: MFS transporter, partial [Gammaproteobacteria bacterium]
MTVLPDRHYRWCVVAVTLVMQAVTIGTLIYTFGLFVLPWLEAFSASRSDVMLAIASLQVGMALLSPFAGRALDVVPYRRLLPVGLLAFGAGLWCVAHATALWQVLAVYGLMFPLATALIGTLAAQTLVTRWFHDQRGLAIGVSAMGTNLGGIVLPLVVGGVLPLLGWRDTLQLLALAGLLLIGPLAWWVLGRNPAPGPRTEGPTAGRVWTTRAILSTRLFWIPVISMAPLNIAFGAVQFNLGAYGQDLGLTAPEAANLIALCSLSMVCGKLCFGWLGDRVDHRLLYWLAAGTMMSGLLLLWGLPALWRAGIGVICIGLAGGSILPMIGLIHGARFGLAAYGRVIGLVMLTLLLSALGPFLAGAIFDATGSYDRAFLLFVALLTPGLLLKHRDLHSTVAPPTRPPSRGMAVRASAGVRAS